MPRSVHEYSTTPPAPAVRRHTIDVLAVQRRTLQWQFGLMRYVVSPNSNHAADTGTENSAVCRCVRFIVFSQLSFVEMRRRDSTQKERAAPCGATHFGRAE
jgi:hypothetical protein